VEIERIRFSGDDSCSAARLIEWIAGELIERSRSRNAFPGVEGDIEVAAAVRVFNPVQSCRGGPLDPGREMNPADEAHGSR
jgi:hypothetical protein